MSSAVAGRCIVCFGDSVTEGVPHCPAEDTFPALLERRLNFRYQGKMQVRVINAGVGGENTAEGLARIERDVISHCPDLVTVEFGLNDIRYEPEKRVLEAQFTANLREMHRRITAAGGRVVFMTPTPIINVMHPYSQATDYYRTWGGCNELNAIYAQLIRETAAELTAPLCDVYEVLVRKAVEAEFLGETFDCEDLSVLQRYISARDGVHPTSAGQLVMAGALYAVIVGQRLLHGGIAS